MKKQLIIQRFQDTIDMMKQLKPEEFDYGDFVSERKENCGTVCCIAGWYPKYFPESELIWSSTRSKFYLDLTNLNNSTDVMPVLMKWHGISRELANAIFYGGPCDIVEYISLNSPLDKVTFRLETILLKIKSGLLDKHLNTKHE